LDPHFISIVQYEPTRAVVVLAKSDVIVAQ